MRIADISPAALAHTRHQEPESSVVPGRADAIASATGPDDSLSVRYERVRAQTEALCAPLEVEDCVISSMPDVSPAKWHLAHTSWFFETFVLAEHAPGYTPIDARYAYLFNSYYVQAGERHCRAQRGLVTRPTVAEVYRYRAHVDEAMRTLCARIADERTHPARPIIELGLHHEQQHQELILMDIKHVFWMNPLRPSYAAAPPRLSEGVAPLQFMDLPAGVHRIGHEGPGFSFDNERPAHRIFLEPSRLALRLTTNAEYLAFIEDGGYRRPELWLSNGWAEVQAQRWEAPLYWERVDGEWHEFTLAGMGALSAHDPVCHVSYYESDAFARWSGHRLPTEGEWEVGASGVPVDGRFVEAGRFHPGPATGGDGVPGQLYGDTWQWTRSPYVAYPGYEPPTGALGEYNGKWMCDQWVLRGASCGTPRSHARATYRNFFPSDARWAFTGVRLASDA